MNHLPTTYPVKLQPKHHNSLKQNLGYVGGCREPPPTYYRVHELTITECAMIFRNYSRTSETIVI